jgi:L-asparaginase
MQHSERLPRCQLIATGGTIAMTADPQTGAAVPALSAEALLAAVPGLGDVAAVDVLDFSNIPSDYMGPPQWVALRREVERALQRSDIAGVVISHGTDTLEETAWFLELTLSSEKPVVLVGAQRNASQADFDGPRNLLAGVRTAVSAQARGRGVLVVMNDRICRARHAGKGHTSAVEAFGAGEAGFAGTVEEARVLFFGNACPRCHVALNSELLPRVDIVAMYGGADGLLVDQAVHNGAEGIVIQALGMGNVNAEMHGSLVEAMRKGVTVVVSTRVPSGRVRPVYGFPGGGYTLHEAGAVFAGDLSPQKARIATMLALQAAMPRRELEALLQGEKAVS